jgi:uncharacterized protein YukE
VAIELPSEVVQLLNFIGINFPQVNEDSVREFATHVRDFATNVDGTHQAATSTVQQMNAAYSGSSYEALVAKWSQMSSSHMTELVTACHVVADALDAAADVIVAMKVEAIGELVVLAASFVADQAAAVATFGLAEAALAAIEEAGKKICEFLEQQLEQYVIGKVITAAIQPLEGVVLKAVNGLTFKATSAVLGVGGDASGSGPVGAAFHMIPEDLAAHGQTMQGHADQVASHASTLVNSLSGVSFS